MQGCDHRTAEGCHGGTVDDSTFVSAEKYRWSGSTYGVATSFGREWVLLSAGGVVDVLEVWWGGRE